MSVLRMCSSAKRRWKTLLWLLLMLVVLLNTVVFVGMPASRVEAGRNSQGEDVLGAKSQAKVRGGLPSHGAEISHLRIMRKGLDKSTANNSSSLHYVEWDGKGEVNFDPRLANQQVRRPAKEFLAGIPQEERREVAKRLFDLEQEKSDQTAKTGDGYNVGHIENENDIDKNQQNNNANEEADEGDNDEDEIGENKEQNSHYEPKTNRDDDGLEPNRQESVGSKNGQGEPGVGTGQQKPARNYSLEQVDRLVDAFLLRYKNSDLVSDAQTSYDQFLRRLKLGAKWGPRLQAYANVKGKRSWEQFHHGIRQHALYNPDEVYIKRIMSDLQTKEIVDVEQKEGGTQIKLMITCADEGQALFKPMRFPRDQETLPDHFYFADYERHNAEIAAFHLDRALGFYRVPPTIGRLMNVSSDIHRVSNAKLAKTFFISPVGNWCFHGSCSYYCDSSHPICGHPIMLEGSMAAFLPPLQMAKRKTWRNPWKRSYSKHRKAYWEVYDDLCLKVKHKHPYNEGRRLMDVLDMSVFDFLTGNLDRHHYETFREFGNETFLLHLDNGRAFGKSKYDCISCLAPVRQCCMIRQSTLAKLVKFYQGPDSLSHVMRTSLALDKLTPILLESHLDALDRRVSKILHVIHGCLKDAPGRSWDDVVIDDGVT